MKTMPKGKGYDEWELEGMADTIYQASLLEIKMKKDKTLKKAVNARLKMRQEASKDLVVK